MYEGLKISNEKVILTEKEKDRDGYTTSLPTTQLDIENIKNKFPNYTFKPVYKTGNSNSNYLNTNHNLDLYKFQERTLNRVELKNINNPAWAFSSSGIINITNNDLTSFGFTLSQGRLPQAHNEIAITTHL